MNWDHDYFERFLRFKFMLFTVHTVSRCDDDDGDDQDDNEEGDGDGDDDGVYPPI